MNSVAFPSGGKRFAGDLRCFGIAAKTGRQAPEWRVARSARRMRSFFRNCALTVRYTGPSLTTPPYPEDGTQNTPPKATAGLLVEAASVGISSSPSAAVESSVEAAS